MRNQVNWLVADIVLLAFVVAACSGIAGYYYGRSQDYLVGANGKRFTQNDMDEMIAYFDRVRSQLERVRRP